MKVLEIIALCALVAPVVIGFCCILVSPVLCRLSDDEIREDEE